jgi:hypothetical protein
MSSSKFVITEFSPLSTRERGEIARRALRDALDRSPVIVIDFAGATPTPSFVDECLGRLLVDVGAEQFRRRVKIENLESSTRLLLRNVLSRRAHSIEEAHAESA